MRDDWAETTLGELATIAIGRTPPRNDRRYWSDSLERAFCTIADMTDWLVRPTREGVTELAEREGKAKRVPAGSLIMSFKLSIGRVGFAATDIFPNEAIAWIQPSEEVDSRFLALWLSSLDLELHADRAVKGKTLNGASLRAIPVAHPTPAEQRRIVGLIDVVDRLERTTRVGLSAADQLVTALREELIEQSDAPRERLGELLAGVDGGHSPVTEGRLAESGERAVLKLSAVRGGRFLSTERKAVSPHVELPPASLVRVGDVLITRSNTPATVGAVCHVDEVEPETYLSDLTLRLVPTERVLPAYLSEALNTGNARSQITSSARGTSNSMRKISRTTIRQYDIPVPPIATQTDVVATLSTARAARDAAAAQLLAVGLARSAIITDLLSGEHVIPESYDELLEAVG